MYIYLYIIVYIYYTIVNIYINIINIEHPGMLVIPSRNQTWLAGPFQVLP